MNLTLKETMQFMEQLGECDDFKIIKAFLSQSNNIANSVKLLVDVCETQTKILENENNRIKTLLYFPTSFYYEKYDHKTANKLDYLTRKMQLGYDFDEDDKKFMRNFKLPTNDIFWHDLAEAIKHEQDANYEPKYFNNYK